MVIIFGAWSLESCGVIARSEEAKQLGTPMGVPFFKIQSICRQKKISVFSSNYALYGDMSNRIIHIIKQFEPHVECYSIDEVFILLQGSDVLDLNTYLLA